MKRFSLGYWSPASSRGNSRTKLSLQNLFTILDSGDGTSVFKIYSTVLPEFNLLVSFLPSLAKKNWNSGGNTGGGFGQFFLLQTGKKFMVFGPKQRCV